MEDKEDTPQEEKVETKINKRKYEDRQLPEEKEKKIKVEDDEDKQEIKRCPEIVQMFHYDHNGEELETYRLKAG